MPEMTKQQQFLQRRSRQATDLFCRVCAQLPPRYHGGLCDPCSRASEGDATPSTHGHASARAPGTKRISSVGPEPR